MDQSINYFAQSCSHVRRLTTCRGVLLELTNKWQLDSFGNRSVQGEVLQWFRDFGKLLNDNIESL